ncbi:MAG TPA: 5-formyltetrahydrofolate cyclo-ligase [Chitinophagaceae bacterium]|nr:5-formyltetrahydrofolate cyclo-ligase [Chitinophagaceae bacterium]
MLKKDARKLYREKRMQLTARERDKLDDLLLIRMQTAPIPFIQTLLSYWPITASHEPATQLFSDFLSLANPSLAVCYPRTDFTNHTMEAILTTDDTTFIQKENNLFEPDAQTVIAPEQLDMIFVPLLIFDKAGYRAGFGKGFYDRYLACCRPDCIKIGFSYFEPVERLEDRHEFDVPLNLCITPEQVYVF